jgi:hypothetical protein
VVTATVKTMADHLMYAAGLLGLADVSTSGLGITHSWEGLSATVEPAPEKAMKGARKFLIAVQSAVVNARWEALK